MFLSALAFFAMAQTPGCSLMRPVAADETAARRIAEAVIRNVPALARARAAAAAGRPYELILRPDPDDGGKWMAFEMPRRQARRSPDRHRNIVVLEISGNGLEFRIDRCTGAISRLSYSR